MTVADYVEAYFPILASWAIGAGGAFSLIQSIKMARRECGARRVPNWLVRLMAFAFSGGITTVVGYKIFRMDIEQAITHGWLAAILYPLIMAAAMAAASRWFPEMHRRIQVPTRRPGDRPSAPVGGGGETPPPKTFDPNDTTIERYF